MKKIHLISKTHLDLGFTDYAENIIKRYRNVFIPNAVKLAEAMNNGGEKKFIWTTGSWLIKDSLENSSEENIRSLDNAIKKGYITWHGLPFTTHSELLDNDTFEYGLSISKKLDDKYGRKTIAAKMTDVPGHTKAIVPLLYNAGIKLLHIGVNEASKVPSVPTAFLWRYEGAEVMVIYDASYGGEYKNEYIDDILYFIHSQDNQGPSNREQIDKIYKELKTKYPDYEICGSTLDAYALELLKVKDKLPKVTSEIGDSWIHGLGSDPYKVGAERELMLLKERWLSEGKMIKGSEEYNNFCENLLLVSEHTWGMDVKKYFSDYEHYLKNDFIKARKRDKVRFKLNPFMNLYFRYHIIRKRRNGNYKQGSYKVIEASWREQRNYIDKAVSSLNEGLRLAATEKLAALIPSKGFDLGITQKGELNKEYNLKDYKITFNGNGIKKVSYKGTIFLDNLSENNGLINYFSYGEEDYNFWQENYNRNFKATKIWSAPDFIRPGLQYFDKKYPQGKFEYKIFEITISEDVIIAKMSIDEKLTENCGAPKNFELKITTNNSDLIFELIWLGKEASRLPEAIFINFPIKPEVNSLTYTKMNSKINPYDVVENGNRNLSAVSNIEFLTGDKRFSITNIHSPLVSIGEGKILKFDNLFQDINTKGISFNLYNNIWGTNFPLWYEDNAYFKFILSPVDL